MRDLENVDALLKDPVALTDELARAARELSGCDFGLALHAIADPNSKIQNLASGQAYVSLTDGKNCCGVKAPAPDAAPTIVRA